MNAPPELILVAAVSADGFISTGTGVPWDLAHDKAHFRQVTRGQWLLIGRRTYEEMLGWFHDHHPLVLTRDATYAPPIGRKVESVAEALEIARNAGARAIHVCGGGGAYAAAMPRAHRLIITHVDAKLGAGVPFPPISPQEWRVASRVIHPADVEHAFAFNITLYERPECQNCAAG